MIAELLLSIIVTLSADVNVVCPHNEIYNLCIFAIFPKTGFVNIVPLCYTALMWLLCCSFLYSRSWWQVESCFNALYPLHNENVFYIFSYLFLVTACVVLCLVVYVCNDNRVCYQYCKIFFLSFLLTYLLTGKRLNLLPWNIHGRWLRYHAIIFARWQHDAVGRERGLLCLLCFINQAFCCLFVSVGVVRHPKCSEWRQTGYDRSPTVCISGF